MPPSLVIRLLALGVTFALSAILHGGGRFLWVIYALGFAHYILAVRYSTRQIAQVGRAAEYALATAALIALALALHLGRVSLLLYFGLHHALNEAYRREDPALATPSMPRPSVFTTPAMPTLSAFAVQALAYVVTLRRPLAIAADVAFWLEVALLFAAVVHADLAWRNPARQRVGMTALCSAELASVLLAAFSLVARVEFLDVVLYHFILWALLPLPRLRARGSRALGSYVAAQALLTIGALLVSPLGPPGLRIDSISYSELFFLGSYAHITISFALSDAHPVWMTRFFRGEPASSGAASAG